MTQRSERFTTLNRAATAVTLVVCAGFILVGFVARLPWVVGVFAVLAIAALAVVPWTSSRADATDASGTGS